MENLHSGLSNAKLSTYDNEMVAPRSVKVFWSFSASSFGKFSFKVWGTDSTNFFAY
jgi:hypothetical protein